MKKKSIVVGFLCLLLISACKKEKQNNSMPLVKTINDGTEIDTCIYDNQNKLIRYRARFNSYTFAYHNPDSIVISYGSQRVGLMEYNTFNQLIKYTDFSSGTDIPRGQYRYTYYGDGKLMYRIFNNLSGAGAVTYERDSMYYDAKNCTSFVYILKLGAGTPNINKYTKVFLNKTNTLSIKNFGMQFNDDIGVISLMYDEFIKSTMFDEQLVSEFHREDGSLRLKFEYEFDSQDRVIKRIRKEDGLADYEERFTYY